MGEVEETENVQQSLTALGEMINSWLLVKGGCDDC